MLVYAIEYGFESELLSLHATRDGAELEVARLSNLEGYNINYLQITEMEVK